MRSALNRRPHRRHSSRPSAGGAGAASPAGCACWHARSAPRLKLRDSPPSPQEPLRRGERARAAPAPRPCGSARSRARTETARTADTAAWPEPRRTRRTCRPLRAAALSAVGSTPLSCASGSAESAASARTARGRRGLLGRRLRCRRRGCRCGTRGQRRLARRQLGLQRLAAALVHGCRARTVSRARARARATSGADKWVRGGAERGAGRGGRRTRPHPSPSWRRCDRTSRTWCAMRRTLPCTWAGGAGGRMTSDTCLPQDHPRQVSAARPHPWPASRRARLLGHSCTLDGPSGAAEREIWARLLDAAAGRRFAIHAEARSAQCITSADLADDRFRAVRRHLFRPAVDRVPTQWLAGFYAQSSM
jgi:hypothetical protein